MSITNVMKMMLIRLLYAIVPKKISDAVVERDAVFWLCISWSSSEKSETVPLSPDLPCVTWMVCGAVRTVLYALADVS